MLSRREFLGTVAAGIVTGSASAEEPPPERTPEMLEQFLQNFPKAGEIPGIDSIRMHRAEGARKAFVVFPQLHWDYGLTRSMSGKVNACQREFLMAFHALTLHENVKLRRLFNESTHRSKEQEHMDFYRDEVRRLLSVSDIAQIVRDDSKVGKVLPEGISVLGYVGAAEILSMRGALNIVGAEKEELQRLMTRLKLLQALTRDPEQAKDAEREYDQVVYHMREEFLVSEVAASDALADYAVFGAAHEWKNNVDAHNKRNPKNAITFVEVISRTVRAWQRSADHADRYSIAP